MPATIETPNHYFLEKDRKASFKSWPFTERHDCSITKVCLRIFHNEFRCFQNHETPEYFKNG